MKTIRSIESSDRATMSRYYKLHAQIYDATRWMFLFGRQRIIDDLQIHSGETVLEVGCGTGHNFDFIQRAIGDSGHLIGVDCSSPMLDKCRARIRKRGWKNVRLIDTEYGIEPVEPGRIDVVLMSYSLSMIREWRDAITCASAELREGGRIGVVDFCLEPTGIHAELFARWLALNHVDLDRPHGRVLRHQFEAQVYAPRSAFAGLWTYFRFVGSR